MDAEGVTLREWEGWAMLRLAEEMRITAAELGGESELGRRIARLVSPLSANARLRLADRLGPQELVRIEGGS